ncbi:hypothetical protein A2U01_0056298, partial [Trifolium medium]|nr:hypothetical protein [Trifolium medium]
MPVDYTADPRDGRETSISSDEEGDGVQILTERQREKRPSTNETLQQQGLRIIALEESMRSKRSHTRSRSRSKTPPRRPDVHNRRPV